MEKHFKNKERTEREEIGERIKLDKLFCAFKVKQSKKNWLACAMVAICLTGTEDSSSHLLVDDNCSCLKAVPLVATLRVKGE